MSDKTLSALTESTAPATSDIFAMVVSGNSRKVTLASAFKAFNLFAGTNTLDMRNGVNTQKLNIYSTYTDASNYRRIEIYEGGIVKRGVGTGIDNTVLYLYNVGSGPVTIGTADTERWKVLGTGHFVAALDNSYDIGASGATRPRTAYLGTSLFVGTTKVVGAQGAAVIDATDAATAITQLNALLARVRAHGLIA
ncbi:MAG: hypothetical protein WC829_02085 [Hyphomicrobium sp.]|jgi:hypothetical protein